MYNIKKLYKSTSWPIYALTALVLIIGIINWPGNRMFLGWDALPAELDLLGSLKRGFTAAWQENWGTGMLAGHGFGATIPHTLIISLLRLFIPVFAVRYIFTVLMLLSGVIGTYALCHFLCLKIKKTQTNTLIPQMSGVIGALFYVTNLGTVQMFAVQLEAFIVQYGSLPWLLLLIFQILERPKRNIYIIFAIVLLFGSIQGFIPPLFIIFCLMTGIILLTAVLRERNIRTVKTVLTIILIIFCTNAYWLFPLARYASTNTSQYLQSYNNLQSTPDFKEKTVAYGSIKDLPLLRNFFFDGISGTANGKPVYMFQDWKDHMNIPAIPFIGYALFVCAITGLIVSVFTLKPNFIGISLTLNAILLLTALGRDIPILANIGGLLDTIPVLSQAFRIAFTKTVFPIALLLSVGISITGFILITAALKHYGKTKWVFFLVLVISMLWYGLPLFQGKLIYKKMLITMPPAYLNLMEYLQTKPDSGRIANLPQDCPEGWTTMRWGYTGSGFLWYGVRQPVLDRSFDVWNRSSENYYWELTSILRSENFDRLIPLLTKYQIQWLLWDPNIGHCSDTKGFIHLYKLEEWLKSNPNIRTERVFSSSGIESLVLYKFNLPGTLNNISLVQNAPNILPAYSWSDYDHPSEDVIPYSTQDQKKPDIYYPFRSFFTGRQTDDLEASIIQTNASIRVSTPIFADVTGYQLNIPDQIQVSEHVKDSSASSSIQVLLQKTNTNPETPDTDISSLNILAGINQNIQQTMPAGAFPKSIHVEFEKTSSGLSYGNLNPLLAKQLEKNCTVPNVFEHANSNDRKRMLSDGTIQIRASGKQSCIELPIIQPLSSDYLLAITSRTVSGNPIKIVSHNNGLDLDELNLNLKKNADWNTQYIIIPKSYAFGPGRTIKLIVSSLTHYPAVSEIQNVSMWPIPLQFLTSLQFSKNANPLPKTRISPPSSVYHPNPAYYKINFQFPISKSQTNLNDQKSKSQTLILSQSYDEGWRAYRVGGTWLEETFPFVFGRELKNHVLVNNWENAWILPEEQFSNAQETIVIFFLPQLLQWTGFALLPIPFLMLLFFKKYRI